MLSHVGVNNQKQETSIEELGIEDSIGDGSKLLRICVLSDPCNQFDNCGFQNKIDSNDDEGNRLSENLGVDLVAEVLLADWLSD